MPVSQRLWDVFVALISTCKSDEGQYGNGHGSENIYSVCNVLKIYVTRDPEGMLKVPGVN